MKESKQNENADPNMHVITQYMAICGIGQKSANETPIPEERLMKRVEV